MKKVLQTRLTKKLEKVNIFNITKAHKSKQKFFSAIKVPRCSQKKASHNMLRSLSKEQQKQKNCKKLRKLIPIFNIFRHIQIVQISPKISKIHEKHPKYHKNHINVQNPSNHYQTQPKIKSKS